MKEPKYIKYEDNQKASKRYNFFEEGLFPEKEEEKKIKNKSSQKKKQKPPFSMPADIDNKKVPNTQNDDLLPFFAKNYPSSSESKEEICFINSPTPSKSITGDEAEEVEGIEEEDGEDKSNEKYIDVNNEQIGQSIDYNSEIEAEQERPSKMMSREEVLERFKRQEEKKREEKRRKEEEEKKKKEEEEKKKMEEEKRKKKEEEEKRKKEEQEKKLKLQEERRRKIIEEEKKRQKEEEEQRKKELERKKKLELEKKKKEEEKKLEEEKKNNIKSGNKNAPLNLLSSIKKNSNDNSYVGSNSILNDVKQMFPGAIPEENNESDEDDYSKKNYKNSSKKKYPSKSPKQTESKKDIKNPKSKSKSKKVSNFNDNLKKENTKKNNEKSKKSLPKSKKSNGLEVFEVINNKNNFDDDENIENLSNYGDELENSSESDDDKPKKKKIKEKRKKKKNSKTNKKKGDIENNNNFDALRAYQATEKVRTKEYIIIEDKNQPTTFGKNGRYSLRHRIRKLRPELGEKVSYIIGEDGPELNTLTLANGRNLIGYNEIKTIIHNEIKKKRKKKLKKGSGILVDNNSEDKEKKFDYNSEELDSQNVSEYGEDESRILVIPKGGKKSLAKNYDTLLIIEIQSASGKNMIKVDDDEYRNLKTDDKVKVRQNQSYEILNFSDEKLVVQLILGDDDDNNY